MPGTRRITQRATRHAAASAPKSAPTSAQRRPNRRQTAAPTAASTAARRPVATPVPASTKVFAGTKPRFAVPADRVAHHAWRHAADRIGGNEPRRRLSDLRHHGEPDGHGEGRDLLHQRRSGQREPERGDSRLELRPGHGRPATRPGTSSSAASRSPADRRRSRCSSTPRSTTRSCTRTSSATTAASTWDSTARCRRPAPATPSTPTTPAGTSTAARSSWPPWSRRGRPATRSGRCLTTTSRPACCPNGTSAAASRTSWSATRPTRSSRTRTRSAPAASTPRQHSRRWPQRRRSRTTSARVSPNCASTATCPTTTPYGCCNFYGPVSTQLEYDTADYAIAALARATGDSGGLHEVRHDGAELAGRLRHQHRLYAGEARERQLAGRFHARHASRLRRGHVRAVHADGAVQPAGADQRQGRQPGLGELPQQPAVQHHQPRAHQCQAEQRAEPGDPVGVRLRGRAVPDAADRPQRRSRISTPTRRSASSATTTSAR